MAASDIVATQAVHVAAAMPTCPAPMMIWSIVSHAPSFVLQTTSRHIVHAIPKTTSRPNKAMYGSSAGTLHMARPPVFIARDAHVQRASGGLRRVCCMRRTLSLVRFVVIVAQVTVDRSWRGCLPASCRIVGTEPMVTSHTYRAVEGLVQTEYE